jgi:hypothetical protein
MTSTSRLRPPHAAGLLALSAVTVAVLAGCSGGGSESAAPAGSGSSAAPASSSAPAAADPMTDLCAFAPKEEMSPVLSAYDSPVATERSSTEDGVPTCTITGTNPDYVTMVRLSDESFAETVKGEIGPGDAPPENDSVWLPKQAAFAAKYGERTLLVSGKGDTGVTATMLFVMGTVLDHLP